MAAAQPNLEDENESPRVISPFAQTTSTVQPTRGGGSSSWALWLVSSLLILVIVGVVGYFTYKYLAIPTGRWNPSRWTNTWRITAR